MAANANKLYDLLVFGVTGFTGKYVAEEIYRVQTGGRQSLKWAVAGRSESKVNSVLQELGIEGVDVVVADVNDEESIEAMCARTRVVVNVVGPYLKYGEVVVKSCVKEQSDYVDITGEEYFVELMVARYGEAAVRAGVYIVNFCGFDCVPTDIGTSLLQKNFEGELKYVECYVSSKTKVLNTGTWESLLSVIRTGRALQNHRRTLKSSLVRQRDHVCCVPKRWPLFYSHITHSWCIPFPGGDSNCITKSALHRHFDNPQVPMISNKVYLSVGSFFKLLVTGLMFMIILPLNATNWGFNLLCKFPRFFTGGQFSGKGPNKEQIAQSSFCVTINGVGKYADNSETLDARSRVKIQGGEPAYVATSVMLVHCAMCLIEERNKLPKEGGIYTPGAAFGNTNIVERLEETGQVEFTSEQWREPSAVGGADSQRVKME